MIERINSNSANSVNNLDLSRKSPNFKGLSDAVLNGSMSVLQACEANPMLNVAVLDFSTAIIPRTVVEGQTNPYAGFEAFRRESSGLIVNCMIPSFIVLGMAKAAQGFIMGAKSEMASCWANKDTIEMVIKYWNTAEGTTDKEKVADTFRKMLKDIQGVDGAGLKSFEGMDFEDSIKILTDNVFKDIPKQKGFFARWTANKAANEKIKQAYQAIVDKAHISENIKFGKTQEFFSQNLGSVIESAPKILRELTNGKAPKDFADRAVRLVTTKSLLGLGIVIPLAMSMQPLNRWFTAKTSGKKGAPIYKDFTEAKSKELNSEEKSTLFKQKLISVSSMIGVALLSMMKIPNLQMIKNTLQFKGIFPSMDQARIISTATFASRMASSEDKNDLREATVRDIATFLSFYFIGDYVAKGIAAFIQKTKGIQLLNVLSKAPDKNAGLLQGFRHWIKNTALKSSDEVYGATASATKYARQMRSLCQLGNIVFSMIALGIIIPKMYRAKTNKEYEKELKEKGINSKTADNYYPAFAMKTNEANKTKYYHSIIN